jgi:hypothetical protein
MTMCGPVRASRVAHFAQAFNFYKVCLSERDAWFGATLAALFNALGMLLEIAIVRKIPGVSAKPPTVSALVGLVLLLVLFIQRKRPSHKCASLVFSLNTASVVIALLSTNLQFAVWQRNWAPFQAIKLGCLVAAILAPAFWVGFLSILAYCLSALLQFEFFFSPVMKAQVAPDEPWPILAFGLAGILALVYRFRGAQLEQEVAMIQAHNFAIRRLTNASLNIRDRMNTPLQVIEISTDLLRNSNESPKQILDRIDRSVQSLREINSMLVRQEKAIESQTHQYTGSRRVKDAAANSALGAASIVE